MYLARVYRRFGVRYASNFAFKNKYNRSNNKRTKEYSFNNEHNLFELSEADHRILYETKFASIDEMSAALSEPAKVKGHGSFKKIQVFRSKSTRFALNSKFFARSKIKYRPN